MLDLNQLQEFLVQKGSEQSYNSTRLKTYLERHYENKLMFQQIARNKPQIVFSADISLTDAIKVASSLNEDIACNMRSTVSRDDEEHQVLIHAAMLLRSKIKGCEGLSVNSLSANDINLEKAYSIVPPELYSFLQHIIDGVSDSNLSSNYAVSEASHRHILSVSQDLLYMVSKGRCKTPKHVGLAMAIKQLTGSKTANIMLNRAGHCISYEDLERIDTAIAKDLVQRTENTGVIMPSNIQQGIFVHAAADNLDINEETIDGRNTTHATSIVLYQRIPGGNFGDVPIQSRQPSNISMRERTLPKRNPDMCAEEFVALGKRPQPRFDSDVKLEWFHVKCPLAEKAEMIDFAWILSRNVPVKLYEVNIESTLLDSSQSVPGWSAFNAILTSRYFDPTTIGYCPLENANPTEYNTVYNLMRKVQAMMASLNQTTTVLTVDAAIYMKAKEIQWRKWDEFHDILLRMGGFHVALNFMSVLGHLYADSGIEDLLIEAGIYGSTTVTKIMKAKSYNRGVRTWKILFEAMMRLKIDSFLTWTEEQGHLQNLLEDDFATKLMQLHESFDKAEHSDDSVKQCTQSLCNALGVLHDKLSVFTTLGREMSATFAFWDDFLQRCSVLLRFIRAERDAYWMLHLSTVAEMLPFFFVCDHSNYSRWATVYVADMRLLPEQRPQIHDEFMSGNHSVGHSSKPFCQVWSDMALEQSINCHSKSKSGVIGFTKKSGALDRWFINAHERAAITKQTLAMLDLGREESKHKELGKARMLRDQNDVKKVEETLLQIGMNPFKLENLKCIQNIMTGTVASDEISSDILQAKVAGTAAMEQFVKDRLVEQKVPFFDPIKKVKLKTFSTLKKVTKSKSSTGESISISTDRELFSRIVVVAKSRDIDLKEMLTYELSPVPLALAKPDGSLNKTAKQTLLAELEKNSSSTFARLPTVQGDTAWMVDGMAMLQMSKTSSLKTFGDLSEFLFDQIMRIFNTQQPVRVDVLFDRYDITPSIKSAERARRSQTPGHKLKITNANMPLPKQWDKYLANPQNKTNLSDFLSNIWITMATTRLMPRQTFCTSGGFQEMKECKMVSWNPVVKRMKASEVIELQSNHEEADTRLLLHAAHASRNCERVVVWTPDTDVFILMVHFSQAINAELWLKTGVKDRSRFIDVRNIANDIGIPLLQCLLPIHALTGCDTVSSFSSKGKVKPWRLIKNNPAIGESLVALGDQLITTSGLVDATEQFVCNLYDKSSVSNINLLRYRLFSQKQARNEALPPTKDSLCQHTKRANFQAYIWKHALEPMHTGISAIGNGWAEEDGKLVPVLMTTEAAPSSVLAFIQCGCTTGCTRNCKCVKHSLACTDACRCASVGNCQNSCLPATSDTDSDGE